MARRMSHAQRRAVCMQAAEEMIARLEAWYDADPDASFGEIEQQARQERRERMGQVLGVLINGWDTEVQAEAPGCERCGVEMELKGYREWTCMGWKGTPG